MYVALAALRDSLKTIEGVQSCLIGYEDGISPAHYPMIRIVPTLAKPGQPYGIRTVETLIYFGDDVSKSQGLELVYYYLDLMEEQILQKLKALDGVYLETITDQDRGVAAGATYKLMAIRCEIKAERPTQT